VARYRNAPIGELARQFAYTPRKRKAEQLGRLLDKPVVLMGAESPDAFLSNARLGYGLLGAPRVPAETLIAWIADWQLRGGPILGKPTHFQTRDGKF